MDNYRTLKTYLFLTFISNTMLNSMYKDLKIR